MYKNKKLLGIIPARGGSKGLPRKNILDAGGKPLIAWSIEMATESRYLDRTIVSTDDDEIADIARACGGDVPFMRPTEHAADNTPMFDAVMHALDTIDGGGEYDFIVLLQPTSPLRVASDIDGAIEHCIDAKALACVSVVEASKSPYWMFKMGDDNELHPLIEGAKTYSYRQEIPKAYLPNGAVYVTDIAWLKKHGTFYGPNMIGYAMPAERSVDIDSNYDMALVREILSGNHN